MKKKLLNIGVISALLCVLLAGLLYASHKTVQQYGYPGIKEYLSGSVNNYVHGLNVAPVQIHLKLDDDDLSQLSEQRDLALSQGLMLNIGDNYVNADLTVGDKKAEIEIRLKGHMTDHLQPKKWSFRVKSDTEILGMSRFTLQHPGTRNYVYEWLFHQLAREHGIVALKYDFVEVIVNDESWGIYALEEHFGQELLHRNNRPEGAIIRFDPALYWRGRIDEANQIRYTSDFGSVRSSYVDAYDEGSIKDDPALMESLTRAQKKLEQFIRGKCKVGDVFDTKLLAKYLAIIDLVGGYHSLDWSDVKFYMNMESGLLEPVAYESFGVRKLHTLAGQGRFRKNPDGSDFHVLLFSDPDFFSEYINALETIGDPAYFKKFLDRNRKGLDEKSAILAREFAYKPFTDQYYFDNIRTIKSILNAPEPLRVFLNHYSETHIELVIANTSQFPVRISAIENDNETYKLDSHIVIQPKQLNRIVSNDLYILPKMFRGKPDDLKVKCRIPGGKKFKIEVHEYTYFFEDIVAGPVVSGLDQNESVYVNHPDKMVLLRTGDYPENVVLPEGYDLWVDQGTTLRFKGSAGIYVSGRIRVTGSEDKPVEIVFEQGGIRSSGKVAGEIRYASIRGEGPLLISTYNSDLSIQTSVLKNKGDILKCMFSSVRISNSYLESERIAIRLNYSECHSGNSKIEARETAAYLKNSNVHCDHLKLSKAKKAVDMSQASTFNGSNVTVENTGGFEIKNGSSMVINDLIASPDLHNTVIDSLNYFGKSNLTISNSRKPASL